MNKILSLHYAIALELKRRNMSKMDLYKAINITDEAGCLMIRGVRDDLAQVAARYLSIPDLPAVYNVSLGEACMIYRMVKDITVSEMNKSLSMSYIGHIENGLPVPYKAQLKIAKKIGYYITLGTVAAVSSADCVPLNTTEQL